jgi:hypothetical protein
MRVFTATHMRSHMAEVFDAADDEPVLIQRSGRTYRIIPEKPAKSGMDVKGIDVGSVSASDIVDAVRAGRERR